MRASQLWIGSILLSSASAAQHWLGSDASSGKQMALPELPGGSPFSHCPQSKATDLLNITSVEITEQPVYFDDALLVHIYGEFLATWTSNATINTTIDCGSHCEMYGHPPGETGVSFTEPFCDFSDIEQPLGGKKNVTCPPVKGYALTTSPIYVWPMWLRFPGWYNFTFDAKTTEGNRIYCITTEVCLRWEDEKDNTRYPKTPWRDCHWPR